MAISLRNPALQLSNGRLLELLAHDLFLSEPSVFSLTRLRDVNGVASDWCRRIVLAAFWVVRLPSVADGHLKHHVIVFFICLTWSVDVIRVVLIVCVLVARLGLFWLHVNEFMVLHRHVFLHEGYYSFGQTDLEVERGRPHNR